MTYENPKDGILFDLSLLEEMDDNEYVAEILTTYLNSSPDLLNELNKACSSNSFTAVFKLTHNLKGSTSLLMATGLLKILGKLEEFAKAEISDGLAVVAEQANEEYKKLAIPLKEHLKSILSGSKVSI
jgi:HPt (histidine-containing phosphotransfer) domain-containing protein